MTTEPATPAHEQRIRIGTLVNGLGRVAAESWIRQILPHGFESFSITFWQTLGPTDLAELSKRVAAELAGSKAVISCLSVFGNPLEVGEKDLESLDAWRRCIDAAALPEEGEERKQAEVEHEDEADHADPAGEEAVAG